MAFADNLQSLQESLQGFDVNDIDFENIGAWPLAVKVIAWILAFVVCFAVGFKFDIEDVQANLARVESEESKLKQEYTTKAFQAANLESYRKQMKEMEQSFGALVGQLPSDTEVPGLLEDITNKGVDSGLEFKSIDLKPEQKAEFYVELPIQIAVVGTFHDLGAFVSGVAGLPRIVTLHDFVVKPREGEDTASLEMAITAKTYRYKDARDIEAEHAAARKNKKAGKNTKLRKK